MKDFTKLTLKEKAAILKMRAADLCSMIPNWDPAQEKAAERILDKVEATFNDIKEDIDEQIQRYKKARENI